ncbi:uncharacterized protein LOC128547745 [Mercenaria mercenaria]|uniref:uncharacterized protein LOC128547745 n=1 Tax=Mercenaria mercenaria TaxID=6596 RepID=UPI00234FAB1E|nr:uncharacterized protein LOC128547745 [Mercenaria mercenaria]
MFRSKSVKKKDVRSKSHERVSVSEPYNVRHDIYTGETGLYESKEDPVPPLVLCPEISENDVHSTLSHVSFSQLIKEEIIPAFRSEMVKIIDEKLTIVDHRLCPRCFHTTLQDERGPNLNNRNLHTSSTETVSLDVPDIEQQNTSLKVTNEADIKTFETESNSLESFSYLVDHEKEQHYSSTHTKQSNRYETYRSTIQGQDETQPKSAESLSENIPPRLIKTEKHKYIGRPLSKLDKRECLATALQWHIEELVDGIVFKDSELPDSLLATAKKTNNRNEIAYLMMI